MIATIIAIIWKPLSSDCCDRRDNDRRDRTFSISAIIVSELLWLLESGFHMIAMIAELLFQSDCSNYMETMLKRLSFPNCSWGNIPLDPTEHKKIIKSWLIQWGEKGVGELGRIETGRRAGSGREKGGKWDK